MLPYERLYPVPGLSVTGGDGGDAVALFTARAVEATGDEPPDTRRVSALCQALDGMPLAIELAASRYPTLGLDGLEAGLHERLRFLTVGGHTAGPAPLAARHDRLELRPARTPPTRRCCAASPCSRPGSTSPPPTPSPLLTRDRAAVADGLARLADHSLLIVDRGEPTRYRALETIRQYGEELLDAAGELAAVQARHEAWCRAVLTDLAAAQPDDGWCTRFDRVVDDARAALLRCAADRDRRADAARTRRPAGRTAVAARTADRGATSATSRPRHSPVAADASWTTSGLAAGAAAPAIFGTDMLRLAPRRRRPGPVTRRPRRGRL